MNYKSIFNLLFCIMAFCAQAQDTAVLDEWYQQSVVPLPAQAKEILVFRLRTFLKNLACLNRNLSNLYSYLMHKYPNFDMALLDYSRKSELQQFPFDDQDRQKINEYNAQVKESEIFKNYALYSKAITELELSLPVEVLFADLNEKADQMMSADQFINELSRVVQKIEAIVDYIDGQFYREHNLDPELDKVFSQMWIHYN